MKNIFISLLLIIYSSVSAIAADDILFADFESDNYGDWKVTGTAFGNGPAQGTLPGQMEVSDFRGKKLVNSYYGGDDTTGTLTSPEFKIERKYIKFLIGGGGYPEKTCINLLIDGKVVRTGVGPNTKPGGSEALIPMAWDVSEFIGKTAQIQIVDNATGGWGHINIDHIVFSDKPLPPPPKIITQQRSFTLNKRYLLFPIKNRKDSNFRIFLIIDDKVEREFEASLSDEPDWFAHLDVNQWQGRQSLIKIEKIPEDSKAIDLITQSDTIWNESELYREPLRGQLRFSARRGWINDPNGLVYANGEYHLYFQSDPYRCGWGDMKHWGHAVSPDLVHWTELPIAIYPRRFGDWVYSGSAVVDKNNTSGWKKGKNDLIVAAFTSTARGECIVYSNDDGRTFQEYEGNPVVKHIGRDPRLIWYEPGNHWVMAVYDEFENKRWIAFYTSPDFKSWTFQSRIEGFFECPDIFKLSGKWILTAANSDYMVGQFDGKKFTPETAKIKGNRGRGFYAAQTYINEPKGRIVQIGWLQTETPGMPFNQSMSLPMELKLRQTPDGPRLSWTPVSELLSLRNSPNCGNALSDFQSELIELRTTFEPMDITFKIRGATISYDSKKQEVVVNGHRAYAPLHNGQQSLIVYVDRTALEIFASDGLCYIPFPFKPDPKNLSTEIQGDKTKLTSLEVYKLKSCWSR